MLEEEGVKGKKNCDEGNPVRADRGNRKPGKNARIRDAAENVVWGDGTIEGGSVERWGKKRKKNRGLGKMCKNVRSGEKIRDW